MVSFVIYNWRGICNRGMHYIYNNRQGGNCDALQLEGRTCRSVLFLAKFALRMRTNSYFLASDQNSLTSLRPLSHKESNNVAIKQRFQLFFSLYI